MKFNLGFFLKRKAFSIILLLACIFISLALSDIPFLVSNYSTSTEGMTTSSVVSKINDILNDGNPTKAQKLTAITGLVALMTSVSDQNKYNEPLTDGKLNEDEKVKAIQKLVDDSLSGKKVTTNTSNDSGTK